MVYLIQSWDGVSPWIKEAPPIWMRTQRRDNDPSVSLKVANNRSKLVSRGYIMEGLILVLTSFFSAPKGTYDIRLVFYTTVSRPNNFLWDTNFMFLPMGSLLMMVGLYTYMVDLDVEEMFYNFRISSMFSKYCRVDLGSYLGHNNDRRGRPLWIRWVLLMMGMVLSPYATIQGLLWVSELVRGDKIEPNTPFRWYNIRLKPPGEPFHGC